MAHEIVSLGGDGNINTEMHGFHGKSCLKAAAEIAAELERLGVVTELSGLTMKDTTAPPAVVQATELKIERGQ